jgi:hypothetical protein
VRLHILNNAAYIAVRADITIDSVNTSNTMLLLMTESYHVMAHRQEKLDHALT